MTSCILICCQGNLAKSFSRPSLPHLPGSLPHPVLRPFNGRALCAEHQTQPCQLGPVSLQVDLGVSLQLLQGPRAALIQGHQGAQHGVEAKVHVRSQQIVQQSVDAFSVCGAADKAADFGPEAGGCTGRPFNVVIATGAEGQHALERLVGPQQSALVDSQGAGIVEDNPSILQTRKDETKQTIGLSILWRSGAKSEFSVTPP